METQTKILKKGSRVAIKYAARGSAIFSVIHNIIWELSYSDIQITLGSLIVTAVYGFFLAFFPAVIGGRLLEHLLGKDLDAGKVSIKRGGARGLWIGMAAGLIICLPVLMILKFIEGDLPFPDPRFNIEYIRAGFATLIAALMGGLTGKQLAEALVEESAD